MDTYLLTFFIVLVIVGIATWLRKRYLKTLRIAGRNFTLRRLAGFGGRKRSVAIGLESDGLSFVAK
jgi:hypothetical protein